MIESNPVEGALQTENERKLQSLESLARVLKNGLATNSDRQRRLIQYLVTEELEGRGHRLKAVSIATDVFGRSADFDPQTDSIIRVEMERIQGARTRRHLTDPSSYWLTATSKSPSRDLSRKASRS